VISGWPRRPIPKSSTRRAAAVVLVTKDRDFADLVARRGPPPNVVLLVCGNTSTVNLRAILQAQFGDALQRLRAGQPLVEIG
jgi:predicted nuclease of predicted toxin-antitoxin system